jgi:DNA repair protein RecN (Recombination protein N)
MLFSLNITNFALIDYLELEFGAGLTVLTGETGAGKSIILDAIDVALGGKADRRMVRSGADRGMVEATFEITPEVRDWLKEQEIEPLEDGSFVCSRELVISKGNLRSRSRVNGVLVNRRLMEALRDRAIEITAQGQTVQLLIPGLQRDLLDQYGGKKLLEQRQKVAGAHRIYQDAKNALEARQNSEQERLQRLDLLQYQLKELDSAQLHDPLELENLEQERDRLSHVVELQQLSYQVYATLYQNDEGGSAVADLLGEAENTLEDMVRYDAEISPILEMVQSALTQVVEAGQQLSTYGDSLESDPERLREVGERIRQLKQICRKYGPSLGDAIAHLERLQAELGELTDQEQSLEQLEETLQQTDSKLRETCQKLTKLRQKAATQLEQQLIQELIPLAMEKVQFECRLTPMSPTAKGADQVAFYFSPNPGESVQPLSATASGGEMSRFLLALKACFSEEGANTLVFDEIDVGVSGKVAQAIATKLHFLSQRHQVLCVTHQPLVAAMADTHIRVNKITQNGQSTEVRTIVQVTQLDNPETRRKELAELAGGHSAQGAIAFADSLLIQAAAQKS